MMTMRTIRIGKANACVRSNSSSLPKKPFPPRVLLLGSPGFGPELLQAAFSSDPFDLQGNPLVGGKSAQNTAFSKTF